MRRRQQQLSDDAKPGGVGAEISSMHPDQRERALKCGANRSGRGQTVYHGESQTGRIMAM